MAYKSKGYITRRRRSGRAARQSRFAARRFRYRVSRKGYRRLRFAKVKRPIGGFPIRKNTVLRYVEDFSLDPGDGSSAVNVFSTNNLYDPNYTGTGHQPMFFDNYSALYSKYKVNSATVTMVCLSNHIVNTTVADQVNGTTVSQTNLYNANERASRMFILMDQSPTDYPSDLDNLIEEGNAKLRWKFAPSNTSGRMHQVRFKALPHKLMNISFRDDSLSASTGGGPNNQIYAICGVDSMPGYNGDAMRYQVIITYNVTFFDFKGNQTQN